jgi:broad specificity phosphatase PhoE
VAIAKAIEEAIGKRQGQRTDMQLQQNFAEVPHGTQTRDVAAQKAGFGNPETYRQAKRVVERGVQELVEAMDAATTHTARRKQLYEALHPEARHRSSEKQSQRGSAKPADTVSPGFSADTAAKTGLTERTVQRYAQVGERLDEDVKEAIAPPPRAACLRRHVWLME